MTKKEKIKEAHVTILFILFIIGGIFIVVSLLFFAQAFYNYFILDFIDYASLITCVIFILLASVCYQFVVNILKKLKGVIENG